MPLEHKNYPALLQKQWAGKFMEEMNISELRDFWRYLRNNKNLAVSALGSEMAYGELLQKCASVGLVRKRVQKNRVTQFDKMVHRAVPVYPQH